MKKLNIAETFYERCRPLIEKEVKQLKIEFPQEVAPVSSNYRVALYASLVKLSAAMDEKIRDLAHELNDSSNAKVLTSLASYKEELERSFINSAIIKEEVISP